MSATNKVCAEAGRPGVREIADVSCSIGCTRKEARSQIVYTPIMEKGESRMKHMVTIIAILFFVAILKAAQTPEFQGKSPKEVVEQLWKTATEGELLIPDGWKKASRVFVQPSSNLEAKVINVISNYYTVDRPRIDGTTAKLIVWYEDVGQIDSALRFIPARPSSDRTAYPYNLVLAPSRLTMIGPELGPDGQKVVKEMKGPSLEWQINGSLGTPWTTVNTAIRYVLERQTKTTDPATRKNADKTLITLLHYQ